MQDKIKSLKEIKEILSKHKKDGKKIVQCHGVFDLLHPGHIRHFKEAKSKGDTLVVTVTPDKYVNKGPGRPAFNQNLRLESLASLAFVDYVVLNDTPDAVNAIECVKPHYYAKGKEYKDFSKDVTKKIIAEKEAVEKEGGEIFFTDDIIFSSSSLINRYIDSVSEDVLKFMESFKKIYSADQIISCIEGLRNLKVLIIGDAIIDEYQYIDLIGQTGKGYHLVGVNKENEFFLGGSLIIANHVAEFSDNIKLITGLGKDDTSSKLINKLMNKKIKLENIYFDEYATLKKKRYVSKDGDNIVKFFETYSSNCDLLNEDKTNQVIQAILKNSKDYDLILVCDFGNGFLNKNIRNIICKSKNFLSLNCQINSGNRGFNVVTHYSRANYISINELELRLAAHDRRNKLDDIANMINKKMKCENICVTLGTRGVHCLSGNFFNEIVPAFTQFSVDRVGAGDSFLAVSSLLQCKYNSLILSAFVGSVASAMKLQYVGNKKTINKVELSKYIIRLYK